MSERQNSDVPDAQAESAKSARKSSASKTEKGKATSTWRTYAVRVVILLMAVVVFAEFWAQSRFRHNLKICQEALDRAEDRASGQTTKVTYDELKDKFKSVPNYAEGVHQFAKCGIYTWNFQGVRHYTLRLFVNPQDQSVYDIETEPAAQ